MFDKCKVVSLLALASFIGCQGTATEENSGKEGQIQLVEVTQDGAQLSPVSYFEGIEVIDDQTVHIRFIQELDLNTVAVDKVTIDPETVVLGIEFQDNDKKTMILKLETVPLDQPMSIEWSRLGFLDGTINDTLKITAILHLEDTGQGPSGPNVPEPAPTSAPPNF